VAVDLGDARGVIDSAPAEASFVHVKGVSELVASSSRSGAGVNSNVNCEACLDHVEKVKYTSI
jgi:hypothetical protein